jgi:hypothetical protein
MARPPTTPNPAVQQLAKVEASQKVGVLCVLGCTAWLSESVCAVGCHSYILASSAVLSGHRQGGVRESGQILATPPCLSSFMPSRPHCSSMLLYFLIVEENVEC